MAEELEKRWNKLGSLNERKHDQERKLIQKPGSQEKGVQINEKPCEAPKTEKIFFLLMVFRMYSAFSSHITDCDEAYNYWEPTHYLVYGKGFQTWEYNPKYGLRSYLYVGLHSGIAKIFSLFVFDNKVAVFYMTRVFLAIFCAVSEDQFYTSCYKTFGSFIANCWLILTLFAPGMFISSSAFLPSSFAMCCITIAYAAWLDASNQAAVIWIAIASLVGWPFVAILGIPIAYDIIINYKSLVDFIRYFLVALAFTMVPILAVDFIMYGKLVIAPLNILLYNVYNVEGSTLYGTEPLSYYLINGFLNFNFAFFFALLSLPLYILYHYFYERINNNIYFLLAPMYLWFGIMFSTPHKEERFLYPVYPFISLAAALVLCMTAKCTSSFFGYLYKHIKKDNVVCVSGFFVIYIAFCMCRISALQTYYNGPMHVYKDLYNVSETNPTICIGKEWHRFPSHFFVPHGGEVGFIKSAFKGQLPQKYANGTHGTSVSNVNQNEWNKEESSVYIDIKKCDYLIDCDFGTENPLEPRFNTKSGWTSVKSYPFLNAAQSKKIARAFNIPGYSKKHVKYATYHLLKRTKLIKKQELEEQQEAFNRSKDHLKHIEL